MKTLPQRVLISLFLIHVGCTRFLPWHWTINCCIIFLLIAHNFSKLKKKDKNKRVMLFIHVSVNKPSNYHNSNCCWNSPYFDVHTVALVTKSLHTSWEVNPKLGKLIKIKMGQVHDFYIHRFKISARICAMQIELSSRVIKNQNKTKNRNQNNSKIWVSKQRNV